MSNMNKAPKTYEYESQYGGTYILAPHINSYANNNNLYMAFDCYSKDDDFWEPFCDATVNVTKLPYLFSTVDTNNNGYQILDFLEANGFGQRTGFSMPSGFCIFPVFHFNAEKLKEIDPEAFKEYQKAHGKYKEPLEQKISSAQSRTEKESKERQEKDIQR